jgi:hypothetical protein
LNYPGSHSKIDWFVAFVSFVALEVLQGEFDFDKVGANFGVVGSVVVDLETD